MDDILRAISQGKFFLISSHINLEGDSLGSELAVAYLLTQLKKNCFICNATPIPRIFNFLPFLKFIVSSEDRLWDFDTAIILDCSDLERLGRV